MDEARRKYHREYKRKRALDPEYRKKRNEDQAKFRNENRSFYNERLRKYRQKYRMECLVVYGGNPPKCKCCGEFHIEFLAVDHINNDGAKDRRENGRTQIYARLRKNGFPAGFQVLCHNCNMAKQFYKQCPHLKTNKKIICK